LLTLAMGVFFTVAFFKDDFRSTLINECTKHLTELQDTFPVGSTDRQTPQQLQDACSSVFYRSRIGVIISFCLTFFVNLCMSLLCAVAVIHPSLTAWF
jgi:hypothetical protein